MSGPDFRPGRIVPLPCDDFAGLAPGESKVLTRYFWGIDHIIRNQGKDPDDVLATFGIDPHAFFEPERHIECARALPLIEGCSFLLDDPLFGLSLADKQEVSSYGYLAPLCRSAPDLRSALKAFTAYVSVVISPEGMFQFLEGRESFEIRWDCDSGLRQNRQGNLHGAAILVKLLRSIIGADFRPLYVNLPDCWRGKHVSEIAERFGCEVRLPSHSYGGVVFSASYASRTLPEANRFAFRALERPLAAIKQQIEGKLSARVKAFVRDRIDSPDCTVETCAAALNISVRTLQKHLARTSRSFSGLVEDEKCEMAKAALQFSGTSLDELAYQLGYAEQSTFGRAFRRWTGMTPGEFRRAARPASIADRPIVPAMSSGRLV